ncbi:NADPH-dependent 2,4-dienoyl-CoA reductase/sulfur reductase-like enzyme [Pseudomonas nitritireducens]|uniref:NADPH-dependent 2,4-dienoyl-CoA reductase/sulfur reductase-like enzyme n=1 Tax=Pseudomonas nitroreducens TaxID=46680 RepID=A0A7W7KRM5_PSENT|nr:FAD-dependent oxidoreductase [Pseudomonas nitritireducens]MBB4867315.1 NADPH-dependent 2,4-dienoyl-CoA reductase/sulfur reductase-like enzyme [Pseudomonas nitritireducens]
MTRTESIDVAIIGSGPAGLAAAIELKRQGVAQVCVFERESEAGGIPRHCGHPPFGLREHGRLLTGPAYARLNAELAEKAGVDIRLRHSVVSLGLLGRLQLATPDGALAVQAKRVLLATGARETPRSARLLGGDRPLGVINTGALQSYLYLQGLKPFERPLIVGTELVSLSSVLSCRRAGIRPVAMIEAGQRATARWPLSLFPRLCGVPMHFGCELVEIHGTGRVEAASVRFADGRTQRIECDGVLLTGRFTPESSLVRQSHLHLDPASGGPSIDQFGRCSDTSYFAAGNLLRPIETAGWSYREGKRIAQLIASDLKQSLPTPLGAIAVKCAAPLKLCVPQRLLSSDISGMKQLQLRVERAVSAQLQVCLDGREIWRRQVSCLPERRLLIPLHELPLTPGAQHLDIAFLSH